MVLFSGNTSTNSVDKAHSREYIISYVYQEIIKDSHLSRSNLS